MHGAAVSAAVGGYTCGSTEDCAVNGAVPGPGLCECAWRGQRGDP